ncbi:ATP/GTP-binding protein [Streptomyces sp. NPDC019922]|uniref:GTP-binding protein n=1 Tax=Streptomyces TaxID=1883 RepID=UPI00136D566F|nr:MULTISPECIES: ATP/GTP-binding protein [unclassified Streptomyces]MDX2623783.1 ATP/GTP-binding protein [Streptomyces sp. WI03-5b]MYT58976.1 ATP/GTP-binding protein [Streptomyces sp. SID7834]
MRSTSYEGHYLAPGVDQSVKLVVLGPFGVGKTTLVGAVSEIEPASTEERMTRAGETVDTLRGLTDKTTTTVALDFGRLTLTDDIVLYLFGGPGQSRFSFMIDELMHGALGGVVLVDTARVTDSWDAMERLEEAGLPYVVAVNTFAESPRYGEAELRQALDLHPSTPLVMCDVRRRESAKTPLIALVSHLLSRPSLEPAS